MSEKTKAILLRVPLDLAAELSQAEYNERRTATEILLQALAIRLRALQPGSLDKVLERIGYQEQRRPGRPRQASAAPPNGQRPDPPADPPGDHSWDLETGP